MPQSHRHTDICTGHSCWPPRQNVTASINVFVNNLGQHRVTDGWKQHCCGTCHGGIATTGSPNVFTNNLKSCRILDAVSCGSFMMTGSPNVWINP